MIRTPAQPIKRYGIEAVAYDSEANVVLFKKKKRRRKTAELLRESLELHPKETVYVGWDNAITHEDDEVEAVVRGAAGRLVLLYLPTYSPWLNPIVRFRKQLRSEATHCDIFGTIKELVTAATGFFERYNLRPQSTRSIIGTIQQN